MLTWDLATTSNTAADAANKAAELLVLPWKHGVEGFRKAGS